MGAGMAVRKYSAWVDGVCGSGGLRRQGSRIQVREAHPLLSMPPPMPTRAIKRNVRVPVLRALVVRFSGWCCQAHRQAAFRPRMMPRSLPGRHDISPRARLQFSESGVDDKGGENSMQCVYPGCRFTCLPAWSAAGQQTMSEHMRKVHRIRGDDAVTSHRIRKLTPKQRGGRAARPAAMAQVKWERAYR